MHSSIAPQMDASLESKFSAAFEQQNATNVKSQLCNGGSSHKSRSSMTTMGSANNMSTMTTTTTTATPNTESASGEKTVSFRKGNDLESFEALSSLFANGLFTDLVICCAGKMFKCHRVVMAAASLYIRDALSAFYNNSVDGNSGCNHCNTVMILPKEVKTSDMEAILRFIYDGHVEVKVDSIESFLKSARMLNIKGLSNVNIVFNNGNTSATDESVDENLDDTQRQHKSNNGYHHHHHHGHSTSGGVAKNHTNTLLTNGHAGMNSPPPSPPLSLNSSLASLKALAAASRLPSPLPNGNHGSSKHLNGLNPYRHGGSGNLKHHHQQQQQQPPQQPHPQRDQSPARSDHSASLLSHNLTPAHQSSTPKSIFANGNLFANNLANSIVPSSGGSRRKQKFPTNIPPAFLTDIPPLAAALYNTWLSTEEEEDEEADDASYDEKKLVIKDDSSNDCSITGDNQSNASIEHAARNAAAMSFGVPPLNFNPQMPCMIEVEADPTNFPTYCHDLNNENATLLQTANSKRRRHFKSAFPGADAMFSKKLKLPYGVGVGGMNSSPSSDHVAMKPSSPLITNSSAVAAAAAAAAAAASAAAAAANAQQSSPVDLLSQKKSHSGSGSSGGAGPLGLRASALAGDKPLFSAYSTVKTAAGANPAASSPSSTSSVSASGSWAGNKWKCDICNKYYGNKQTLKEHMDYFHSNREEQIYICNICNKEYTWRKSLMKHYRDIHQMRNTPALAEINRQLAALATTKSRSGSLPPHSPAMSADGNVGSLQSYVSIANAPRKSPSKGSSGGGGGCSKSEIDEGDNDNEQLDAVPEEEEEDEDDSNEEVEIEGESSTNADSHEDCPSVDNGVSTKDHDGEAVKCIREPNDDDDEGDEMSHEKSAVNDLSDSSSTTVGANAIESGDQSPAPSP